MGTLYLVLNAHWSWSCAHPPWNKLRTLPSTKCSTLWVPAKSNFWANSRNSGFFATCYQNKTYTTTVSLAYVTQNQNKKKTRQSIHCEFCIYIFDNSFDHSKLMARLVRAEKMVLSGMVSARKIARMILIQNI